MFGRFFSCFQEVVMIELRWKIRRLVRETELPLFLLVMVVFVISPFV